MIYEDIEQNKRNTIFLFLFFAAIITGLGYFIGEIYGNYYAGVIIAFFISVFSIYTSYYHSDKIVLSIIGAKEADRKLYPQLYNSVEGLSLAAGINPPPKIYIMPDDTINALATGRDPKHSVIAVTEGALAKLDKFELEGVIAHEMSHIKNYDILISSIAAVLIGMIVILSDFITRNLFRTRMRGRVRGRAGIFFLVFVIIAAIIAPIAARIINFALSRQREYMADASAALLTRYPQGLINALEKIKREIYNPDEINRGVQHMYFTTPSYLSDNNLFATHPPIEKRIERLKTMLYKVESYGETTEIEK